MMVALKPWALPLSVLALLVAVTPAAAQFRAGIQGTVTDQTGAVVNGATVTATDNETGRSTTATTSEDGFYRISGLPPGTYTIKVEGKSFKTVTSTVQVAAENIAGFNATLPAGAASESVTVTASTPIIDTESGDVGATLSNEQIQGLPATGRDPYELLRLAPGIFADGSRSAAGQAISLPNNAGPNGSNASIFQVENQVQISANGQRVSANNYEVDFIHQYSHAWIDFHGKRDGFADYFDNSTRATRAHIKFCLDLEKKFPKYSDALWGITASDSAHGYVVWGGPPAMGPIDGSVVPSAAAGSLPFLPDQCLKVLRGIRDHYKDRCWKRYGFVDSFNPQNSWTNPDVIGINTGIATLMAANLNSQMPWKIFMKAPEISRAMKKVGFTA